MNIWTVSRLVGNETKDVIGGDIQQVGEREKEMAVIKIPGDKKEERVCKEKSNQVESRGRRGDGENVIGKTGKGGNCKENRGKEKA